MKSLEYKTKNTIGGLATIMLLCMFFTVAAYGVDRVLQRDWNVNDTQSYTLNVDIITDVDAESNTTTTDLDYTLAYKVDEDNGDNSFDISVNQTSGTKIVNGGAPSNMTTGSSTQIVNDGRGKVLTIANNDDLIPDMDEGWNWGSADADQTGPFVSTAVGPDDEWTQTINVTPYNQSAQDMNISCKLIEWTTLLGYNVGKITRTWTWPISGIKSTTGETLSGSLNCSENWWYSYDDKRLVKSEANMTGTLSYDGGEGTGNTYDVDENITITTTID